MLPCRQIIVELESQTTVATKKSFGLRSGKKIYEGFNDERKVKDRKTKVKERLGFTDYAGDFGSQNNVLPKEYNNKILVADSLQLLKKLPNNCIDLVFTSPPYNFGLDYESHKDTSQWKNYFNTLFEIFNECIRVLKYGGRIIINIQPLFSDYIPSHHIISNFFFNKGLIWRGEILWEKNNYNCKYTAWGSWKSPASPYLKYTWEYLEIFCKGVLKKTGSPHDIDITADEFKDWVNAKWSIAPERDMKKYNHPAMFPEKLVERVLKLFSFERDMILDPFNGAGTTTYVCHKFNRKYLGIDISEEYCQEARKRINKGQL